MGFPLPDSHAERLANLFIDLYGMDAAPRAGMVADGLDRVGDHATATIWRAITRRIRAMRGEGLLLT